MSRRVRLRAHHGTLALAIIAGALYASVTVASMLPDQTWIAGLYDAADEDTLLLLVWDQTPAVLEPPPVIGVVWWPVVSVPHPKPEVTRVVAAAPSSRSPPLL